MKGTSMRTFTRSAAVGLFATALILSGCGSDDETTDSADTTEAAATTEIEVTDVWARQSPMGTTAGAVYMNITSPTDDALVGASVPEEIAGTVEVHETVMAGDMGDGGDMGGGGGTWAATWATPATWAATGDAGDMGGDMGSMTMREVASIELTAGETVALEPGGLHIMLLDLVEPLVVGDTFEVTLTFESGAELVVTAEVREG
jgi:periplasmic copper chaperone A